MNRRHNFSPWSTTLPNAPGRSAATTLRSVRDIARNQRLGDNNDEHLSALEMLKALLDDNRQLTGFLRATHELCDRHGDVASASLIENWIDESERRTWFLAETTRER